MTTNSLQQTYSGITIYLYYKPNKLQDSYIVYFYCNNSICRYNFSITRVF